jgi:uncharacterized protein YidB (DUF937 family)
MLPVTFAHRGAVSNGQSGIRLCKPMKEKAVGLLDGVLGGLVGGGMASAISRLIEQHGGVQGIVAQMEQQGLGATVRSWVGTGANEPISADQIHAAFGSDTVAALAAKVGMNPQELAQKLAQVLPQAIDKLTPTGAVPTK